MQAPNRTLETINLVVATAQADATVDDDLETRTDMDEVYGISVNENSLASITRYTVKLTDKSGAMRILDPVPGAVLAVGDGVDMNGRYFPVSFPAKGAKYKATAVLEGTTSGEFNIDFILWERKVGS